MESVAVIAAACKNSQPRLAYQSMPCARNEWRRLPSLSSRDLNQYLKPQLGVARASPKIRTPNSFKNQSSELPCRRSSSSALAALLVCRCFLSKSCVLLSRTREALYDVKGEYRRIRVWVCEELSGTNIRVQSSEAVWKAGQSFSVFVKFGLMNQQGQQRGISHVKVGVCKSGSQIDLWADRPFSNTCDIR